MAIVVTKLGTNQIKDMTSPWTPFTDITAAAGDHLILVAAFDYGSSHNSRLWGAVSANIDIESFNNGGISSGLYRFAIETGGTNDIVLDTAGSGWACAVTLYKVSGLEATPLDKTKTGKSSGTDANTGATGVLSQADEVVFAASGVEDEVDDPHGTWSGVTGDEQFDATNGGGDASNVQVHSVADIVAATDSKTGVDAGHDSTDWAACIATYKGASAVQELTAAPVGEASSVVQASIAGTGIAPLTGATVQVTSSVQASGVAGTGIAPLTGAAISVASSVVASTIENVAAEQELTAAPVAVSSSVQTASISGSGNAPLTGAAVSVTSSVQAATISGTGLAPLTAAVVSVASSVQTAGISGSGNAPLAGTVVSVASSVQAASIAGSGNAPLTGAAVGVVSSVQASAIAGTGIAPLTGAAVSVASSVVASTIQNVAGDQELTASPIAIASSVQQATLTAEGAAPLTAAPVAIAATVQKATLAGVGVATLTSAPIQVTSSIVAAFIVLVGERMKLFVYSRDYCDMKVYTSEVERP